jgi:hypothetical protein
MVTVSKVVEVVEVLPPQLCDFALLCAYVSLHSVYVSATSAPLIVQQSDLQCQIFHTLRMQGGNKRR